jgi:SNF2-related domain
MLKRSDLFGYQQHAVDFIKSRPNCALFVDMGLGKTATTLTAFADLKASFDASKMLVIAPKRVARQVWDSEVKQWEHLTHLTVSKIVGDAQQCFKALQAQTDVYTIGRDRLAWLHAQFIQNGKQVVAWPFDMVVCDESQSFKSASSQRFKALADLRVKTKFSRLVHLTGTPTPNGLEGLWSQVWLLDRGRLLGNSFSAFRDRWFTPPVGIFTKWNIKPTAAREIYGCLSGIVLALRENDYLELPPVVDNFVCCELSPAAMATYTKFERQFIAEVAGKTLTAVNAGVLDGKLLQLANGACYHGKNGEWVSFSDAKLESLEDTLEAIPGKALIAYSYKHDMSRITERLEKLGRQEGKTWRVLSDDKDFSEWAAGRIDWGVCHPGSMGHGLNEISKTDCTDLIFFGLTANLEYYQQIRARLTGGHRRAGKSIIVHHLVCDQTRDDDYVALIKSKALDQDSLMAALAVRIQ